MIRWILTAAVVATTPAAFAVTKNIECRQTTDKNMEQVIYAKVDDESNKAEVEFFGLSAECAQERTCGIKIYAKDTLPSVISLTSVTHAGLSASYTTIIDINRTDLTVVTRTKLELPTGISESTAHGKCTVKSAKSPKLL